MWRYRPDRHNEALHHEEKNIPIIRVIAQSFAPSFESLAKWLRNSPACEQPCNFSLTCEILLFLTHASFHMRKFAKSSEIGVCAVYWGIFGCRFMAKHLTMFGLFWVALSKKKRDATVSGWHSEGSLLAVSTPIFAHLVSNIFRNLQNDLAEF